MHDRPTNSSIRAGLDDPAQVPVGEGESGGRHREGDGGRLPRRQLDPGVPEQLRDRPGDRGDDVVRRRAGPPRRPPGRRRCDTWTSTRISPAVLDLRLRDVQLAVGERRVAQPVAERQRGGRVEVAHRGGAAEARVQVGVGLRARRAGQADRQPAGRVDPAGQHAGDRRRALLAGEERLHDGGAALERPADRVRAAGQHDQHDRRAGGEHRLDQLALDAGQLEVVAVAALADGPAPEQPGLVADDDDGDVGSAGRPRPPPAIPRRSSSSTAQPGAYDDLGAGQLGAQRVEDASARRSRSRCPGAGPARG